eukprot:1601407-Alexandrium_andersonii.AAC.1
MLHAAIVGVMPDRSQASRAVARVTAAPTGTARIEAGSVSRLCARCSPGTLAVVVGCAAAAGERADEGREHALAANA